MALAITNRTLGPGAIMIRIDAKKYSHIRVGIIIATPYPLGLASGRS
jgi:hypothetical protein